VRKKRCLQRDGQFDESALGHPSETGVDEILLGIIESGAYLGSSWIVVDARRDAEEVNRTIERMLFNT
jgi:thymidylate kinase